MRALFLVGILLLGLSFAGCRGWTSEKPPVHPNPNMDTQLKYKPYRESEFFSDGRDMRPNIEGTVAQGKDKLKDDDHFYRARVNGEVAKTFPPDFKLTKETLERGRERYNIYCAICHSQTGDGNGLVGRRLQVKPTNFHGDATPPTISMRDQPVGHFFDVMTNGIRTMPSYRDKLTEADRWAVAAYIRTLQVSQDADGTWITKSALGK